MITLKLNAFILGLFSLITLLLSASCSTAQKKSPVIRTQAADIVLDTIAKDITIPFGMAFLPDGQLLVTDRTAGKIWRVDPKKRTKVALTGVPAVHGKDQAGMLDIILHPDFASNGWIYFSYSDVRDGLNGTVVDRARLQGNALKDRERIFTCNPFFSNGAHYGSRLVFDKGFLYLTVGERYALRDSAQLLANDFGKVIRIRDDGTIPSDNPFVNTPGARPEIWSYGHRNPQGLAIHPQTGELWESEHGPKGGDETNIIRPGKNYGWPVITYGVEYSGATIGDGITEKAGMEQPVKYYKPSIGPSGMTFYTGDKFPAWKGNLFTGALALTHLNRLVIADNKVVSEERIFEGRSWRVRNVKQGPDGYLYIGVDGGMVIRIRPAN
jgi:glucose/arabinose dehydrogenase